MSKAISTKRRVELSRQELAKGKPSVDWEGVDLKELNEANLGTHRAIRVETPQEAAG